MNKPHRLKRGGIRTLLLPLLFCVQLLFSSVLYAETEPDGGLRQVDTAPVMVDGEALFHVAGTSSYPALERAEQVSERVKTVARDRSIAADAITRREVDEHIEVYVGNLRVVVLYPVDASAEGVALFELSEAVVSRLQEALLSFREQRTDGYLLLATLKSLGVMTLCVGGIWITVWAFRRWHRYLESRFKERLQGLKFESFEILRAENIWLVLTRSNSLICSIIVFVLIYIGVEYTLSQYPWTRATSNILLDWLIDPLRQMLLSIVEYLPSLIFLVILATITRYCIKLLYLFFLGVEKEKVVLHGFEPEWAQPTYKLFRFFIIVLAVVLAYPYIPGSGSAAFQGLSIFLGVMVSLGASSAVASIVAGYAITYRRAFKIGDMIKVGEYTGVVEDMRLLVTHLRTFHNEEVVLPNSQLLNSSVINLSRPAQADGLVIHTSVGIGYETPWRQVEAMLKEAASRTRSLKTSPAPFVLVKKLGDYGIEYQLNVYVSGPTHLPHRYADLHRNILDVFNEYGVAIMTPSYVADPADAKLVPPEDWFAAPAKAPEANAPAARANRPDSEN
ncbi:mechanosensitive ion channel family protein [Marinobacterium lutimaris]|uniref:Small-conductance mechanosensitive channel n=1 Tax=Marinobacterium lutimaris TaxID=568106 RepID=A0A1H5ZES7_9GAMM|nr:mechanosensitive ion channel family protein [Marinobacterium lutimaris]SEG34771.1 Small-conductance mechanosensitive channel [Marinobacterium lutimaris]